MDTSAEMWALVGKLIALVAIPHAAAQGLSKVVAISNRPGLAVVARTMDAATYVALTLTSATIVHVYLAALHKNPSSAEIEAARNSATLGAALELYVTVYIIVLIGLGALAKALKTALHGTNPKAVKNSLVVLGAFILAGWMALLERIARTIDWFPTNGAVIGALLFGPPLLGVLVILGIRTWDQRRTPPRAGEAVTAE